MSFHVLVKDLRIAQKKTLRQFCLDNDIDPSNWSKIERGVNPPPKDEGTLSRWARALGLSPATEAWHDFVCQADLARGEMPREVLSDEKLVEKLPVFFRTVRGAQLTDKQLDQFIEDVRKLYTADDSERTVSDK